MSQLARDLRKRLTPAERILWRLLRDRRLKGLKFRRQFPIGPFVVDFCCYELRLVIELDGEVHAEPQPPRATGNGTRTSVAWASRFSGFQISGCSGRLRRY